MKLNGQCSDCDFWRLIEDPGDDPPLGFCRRYPPTIAPTPAERQAGEDRWNFIVTAAEDGCGEFR
jgi:hypothetical protein